MQLLGGDADLRAEAEYLTVGEAGGGVVIDGGGIYQIAEFVCRGLVLGDDRLAVPGAVFFDVLLFHIE